MTNTLLLAAPGYWLLIDQPMIRNIVDFSQSDYHSHTLTYGDTSLPTSTPGSWYGVMWSDVTMSKEWRDFVFTVSFEN